MIAFHVSRKRRGPATEVVAVWGEVDMCTAPEFSRELSAAIDGGAREIIIDLTRATFIDCAFIAALLGGRRRLRAPAGQRLTVVCPDANLRRVFELTGADGVVGMAAGGDGVDPSRGDPVGR